MNYDGANIGNFNLKTMGEWIQMNVDLFDIFFLVCVVLYRKHIFTAIAGGNGKLQILEIAQSLLLVVFYISVRAERLRPHEYPVFSEFYWVSLFTSITVIAGIKEKVFHSFKGHKEEKKQE